MATDIKGYIRESMIAYITVFKLNFALKTELSAKNGTNLLLSAYAMPTSTAAIGATDSIQTALGKLEKGISLATTSDHSHANMTVLNATTASFTTALETKLNGIAAGATAYVHPAGDGNLHVPATGTTNNGKVLTAGATAGSLSWVALAATQPASYIVQDANNRFMTDAERAKITNLAANAGTTYATKTELAFTVITAAEATADWTAAA